VLPPDGRCALTRAKHISTNYAEAWLHITHDCSVLFVHVSTDRQDTAACVSLSFLYNVKEPEDFVKPSRHQSRQNTTGPPYLAPDVHFDRSWKRVQGFALTCNPQCEALYALARVSVKVGFREILTLWAAGIYLGLGHFMRTRTLRPRFSPNYEA